MGPLTRQLAVAGLLAVTAFRGAVAQGVTTAALYGVVEGPDSSGIGDAVVTVTTLAGGERWRTTTRADGRFAFEYLSVGGPYDTSVRNMMLIGQGPGNNLILHSEFHVTVLANGTVTAFHDNFSTECK